MWDFDRVSRSVILGLKPKQINFIVRKRSTYCFKFIQNTYFTIVDLDARSRNVIQNDWNVNCDPNNDAILNGKR